MSIRLYHPHGFPVDIEDEERARVLEKRGYTREGTGAGAGVTVSTGEPEFRPSAIPRTPVSEVLSWVGTDLDRAQEAYEIEEARGSRARKSLLDALERLGDE